MLVTGAAGGLLGKAVTAAYLNKSDKMAICNINEACLGNTNADFGGMGRFLSKGTNTTPEKAVQRLVSETVSRFGHLDIVVNHARMINGFSPVRDLATGNNWPIPPSRS